MFSLERMALHEGSGLNNAVHYLFAARSSATDRVLSVAYFSFALCTPVGAC